jgi:hypothetical protein
MFSLIVYLCFFPQLGVLQAVISLFGNELILTSVLTCLIVSILIVMLTLEPALTQFNCLLRGLMLICLILLGTITLKTRLSHALGSKDDVSTTLILLFYYKGNWMNSFTPKIAVF